MQTLSMERTGGRIAISSLGDGPLVLCIPGVGESRASFRHLLPGLAEAGCRAAAMDLRGHGDSTVGFDVYDDEATTGDVLAAIDRLGGSQAILVGNSMGAAAAVLAAARHPDAVAGLVLIGPFVRDHGSTASRMFLRALLTRPWVPVVWRRHYASLFGEHTPDDHDEHVRRVLALLRRPGRWPAFQATARGSHAAAEAALPSVSAPTLVIMGDRDRDFPDPEAEARWAAQALDGEYEMIAGAGHYPMAEQPAAVLAALLPFLKHDRAIG